MNPSLVHNLLQIAVSLFPVFLFLTALIFMDSYKLVRFRSVLAASAAGGCAAAASFAVNVLLLSFLTIEPGAYALFAGPLVEELIKAAYVVYMIRVKKIGFMVDGAIYGFAIGAGFSAIENIYYLRSVTDANLLLWIIRGFGTAVMHGGATAIFAIISKSISDRYSSDRFRVFLPGLAIAAALHSFFNHFFLGPVLTTVSLLVVLPLIVVAVFHQSEQATRHWLGMGFDTDADLLEMISTGQLAETKVGKYLQLVKDRLPGEVVFDMLCLLRLHVELSIRAKGMLLMRGAGFPIPADPGTQEKFEEMKYLQKTIGKTGLRTITPFLHTSSRDLWQLYMLEKQ